MAFLRDLRYSMRSLSRSPALTAALLTTVAVGIGAHATVSGFINALLSRNLAGIDDRRVVAISWQEADGDRYAPVPYPKYLSLGMLGAYGVMSDSVHQKKREIALRIALGARGSNIVGGVFLDGLRIAAAGAAGGLIASRLLVQAVARSNPGIALPTSWMWLSCPPVLLAVVGVASILPARWALAADPLSLLRDA